MVYIRVTLLFPPFTVSFEMLFMFFPLSIGSQIYLYALQQETYCPPFLSPPKHDCDTEYRQSSSVDFSILYFSSGSTYPRK